MGPRRGFKLDLAIPGGAAICETVATFEGCWGVQHSGVLSRFRLYLTIPGAAICETVASFEGCWGASIVGYLPQTQIRPRHPCGAAICETITAFVGPWEVQRSGVLRRPP